jgi:hypothetical protein
VALGTFPDAAALLPQSGGFEGGGSVGERLHHDDPAIAQRADVERRNADVDAAMSTTTNL